MTDKLISSLARIPVPFLSELIGDEILEGLQELQVVTSSPIDLAQILFELRGRRLFSDAGVLRSTILKLPDSEISRIASRLGSSIDESTSLGQLRKKLSQTNWGRNRTSEAICQSLGMELEELLDDPPAEASPDLIEVNPFLNVREMYSDPSTSDYQMFPLHDYQKQVKDSFVGKLVEPGSRFLIHMPTGSGKTKTAIEGLVDFWRVRGQNEGLMIWLAHTKELCNQAFETFCRIWKARGDYPINVAKIFDKHSPDVTRLNSGLCFVGFQKFYALIKRNSLSAKHLRQRVRLVVVDEAHKAFAPTYYRCLEYLTDDAVTRLVGLTATPGRGRDFYENERFLDYFSSGLYGVDCDLSKYDSAIGLLQDQGYLAKLRRIIINSNIKFSAEELREIELEAADLPERLRRRLSTNAFRNLKIVSEIKKAVTNRGDPTLVFATSTRSQKFCSQFWQFKFTA